MKKLVLFFAAAIVAVSFAACGQKAASTEGDVDSTEVVPTEVVEEAPIDSAAAAVVEEAPAAE